MPFIKWQSIKNNKHISSVQSLSCVWLSATPWTAACQVSLSITTPGVHPNPCPLSLWCHLAISSSVVPFSSCPQSLPASGSFPMSQLFTSGGQSVGVSASASVLPMNIQDWSPLGWTGWISLQSKWLSRVFSNTTFQKHQFFDAQLFLPKAWKSRSNLNNWSTGFFKVVKPFCMILKLCIFNPIHLVKLTLYIQWNL